MDAKTVIIKTALISRVLVVLLQYISNHILPDHEAHVFTTPMPLNSSSVYHWLGGFARWDAQYFLHISYYGYTYENTLAFFPLFPILINRGAVALGWLNYLWLDIDIEGRILLSSIILNMICFTLAALALYELSIEFFDEKVALSACKVFCFNPASIFFSAPYSESLFAFLTFKTCLHAVRHCTVDDKDRNDYRNQNDGRSKESLIKAIIFCSLSIVTRSNGVVNIGFLSYSILAFSFPNFTFRFWLLTMLVYMPSIWFFINAIFISILPLLPFILFQFYSYITFCYNFDALLPEQILNHAKINNYIIRGRFNPDEQSWCLANLPLAYSYVQSHYWDVGFLRYYRWNQIPNFLLAAPILIILIHYSYRYYRDDIISIWETTLNSLLPFYMHALFLSTFSLFFMHVQVATRFLLSSSPLFYWICAKMETEIPFFWKSTNKIGQRLGMYCMSYFIVGIVLFCNNFPWT